MKDTLAQLDGRGNDYGAEIQTDKLTAHQVLLGFDTQSLLKQPSANDYFNLADKLRKGLKDA